MLKLNASYGKKVPAEQEYSSKSYHCSVELELSDTLDATTLQDRIHETFELVKNSVETEIQGGAPESQVLPVALASNNGNAWSCSDKQKDLILKLVEENKLDRDAVEQLAIDRFGHGVRHLNKLEASGLIDILFERTGGKNGKRGRPTQRAA